MKITHAIWEQRNLGIDCYEVEIEIQDTLDMLKKRASDYETEYTVIKVPIGMMEISLYLQSAGYTFMEVMTSCHSKGKLPALSRIQQRMVDSVSYEKMNDGDRERLFDEINGGMFQDDRVSLDPSFTQNQANNRYIGWATDERKGGSHFFKLIYKGETVGFFMLKNQGNDIYLSNLGGIYRGYERFGFGICMNYYTIYEGIKQNAKRIVTAFSSNNRGATAIHFSIGLILDQQFYIFIKHK